MASRSLNLRDRDNSKCKRKCNKEERADLTDEDLCTYAFSELDKLPVRCVGEWAYEKIYRLNNYFNIFSSGMKVKWKGNLNYIEICSGPGRCILRDSGSEVDGTSLSIINNSTFEFIREALFIDYNEKVVNILNERIKSLGKHDKARAVLGDYNNLSDIQTVLKSLPDRCLNLVFVDPTDCSVPFSLIKIIKETLINVDFIINIALGTDLNRNIRPAILDPTHYRSKAKYGKFLGNPSFLENRKLIELAKTGNDQKLKMAYLDEYKRNLESLGLKFLDEVTVKHFYILLFASQSDRGFDFWKKAVKTEPNGQINLGF